MDTVQSPSVESLMRKAVVDFEKDDKFLAHLPENSSRVEGQAHYRLAKIFYDKADFEQAEEQFLLALTKSELPQDAFAVFKTYGFLIRIYSEGLNEKEAHKYIELSSDLLNQAVATLPSLNA
ncbi:MAG: hypothetical protein WDA09_02580, partial [Bacteriovoracaceae bacterium]